MRESSWKRAKSDTGKAVHTVKFWISEIVTIPVSGAIAATLAPNGWSTVQQAWFGAGVAVGTAFLLVAVINGLGALLAPARQRNEAWNLLDDTATDDDHNLLPERPNIDVRLPQQMSLDGYSAAMTCS